MNRIIRSLDLARRLRAYVVGCIGSRTPSRSALALLGILDERIRRLAAQVED